MAEKTDDLNLPTAVVTRIIKEAIPEGCNVAKEAKLALARAASVFVLYLTAQANTVAVENNRKTITNKDVMEALKITEFGRFEDPLKEALEQFQKLQKDKKEKKQSKDGERMEMDEEQHEEQEDEVNVEDNVEVTVDEDSDVTSIY